MARSFVSSFYARFNLFGIESLVLYEVFILSSVNKLIFESITLAG